MARRSTNRPSFKSEAEEAQWYATPGGREQTRREFVRALRSGTVVRASKARVQATDTKLLIALMEQAKAQATKAISIRLPIADIEAAKQIADSKGIGYQTVLKQAIRRGLQRAV